MSEFWCPEQTNIITFHMNGRSGLFLFSSFFLVEYFLTIRLGPCALCSHIYVNFKCSTITKQLPTSEAILPAVGKMGGQEKKRGHMVHS